MTEKQIEQPESDYFPYEPDITDIALVVEGRKLHVCKAALMCTSPVFKTMFTANFKEKISEEIEFPEKKFETFVLFLRCIYPGKYIQLNEAVIEKILPLAREYDTRSLMEECQDWMLKDIEFKMAKEQKFSSNRSSHTNYTKNFSPRDRDAMFLVKWISYALEFQLEILYKKCLKLIIPYKTERIKKSTYYGALSFDAKFKLLEARMNALESISVNQQEFMNLMM